MSPVVGCYPTMEDCEIMDSALLNLSMYPDTGEGMCDNQLLGVDIWEKFNLEKLHVPTLDEIPTPPASPKHEPSAYSTDDEQSLDDTPLSKDDNQDDNSPVDDTQWSFDFLPPLDLEMQLQTNLIQDCMWSVPGLIASGFLNQDSIKKMDNVDENSNTICDNKKSSCLDITECVDPASVFPCPTRHLPPPPVTTEEDSLSDPDKYSNLGVDTPPASSESDEEEIDVVSVPERKLTSRYHQPSLRDQFKRPNTLPLNRSSSNLPATASVSAQVAAMHNYSSPTCQPKSIGSGYHSAPSTPSSHSHKRLRPYSSPSSPQSSKKQRHCNEDLKAVARKLSRRTHSSRNSSDLEDNSELGRRAYHNVLERQRRDHLRISYQILRDNVPEISSNERAPKMVILNKATEHIKELSRSHKLLSSELHRQKQTYEQLKRKLHHLSRH